MNHRLTQAVMGQDPREASGFDQKPLRLRFFSDPWFGLLICILLILPFLAARIPPLTDLPGHMGSSAVAAYADDPAFNRLLAFHWHLVPNLGTDIIVALLQKSIGITASYWIVAASIPPLLAVGIFMIAKVLNPRGAAALPWALIFIYSYAFTYGFLNYMLGTALALIGFASWMRLDRRRRLRESATWIAVPLLFLCHAVAGCIFVLLVCSREITLLTRRQQFWSFLGTIKPLLSSVVIILAWRLTTQSFLGHNATSVHAKLNGLIMVLRDQNRFLDEGSLAAALAVFAIGWSKGARPHRAVAPALLFLIPLFVATPSTLNGSSFADERLLPLIPILAFTTQNWEQVDLGLARLIAISGLALFATRLALTFASFVTYNAQFSSDLQALDAVPRYSRIIVLNTSSCSARRHWRASRLGHLGDLAIVYRRSWVNSEWDTDGAHLVQVRFRPSPLFYDDPSQYVRPASCAAKPGLPGTVREDFSRMPFAKIDYVWLIDAAWPAGYHNGRLALAWKNAGSALYAVLPASRPGMARTALLPPPPYDRRR